MSKTLAVCTLSPNLVAFKPRQVLLSQHNMKQRSHALTAASSAVLKPHSSSATDAQVLNPEQRTLLLNAIALYLDCNGFSKTLKKFRSEAQIEKDSSKGFLLNLEDMCFKYFTECNQANAAESIQDAETMNGDADDVVPESQNPTKCKDKKKKKRNVVSESQVDVVKEKQLESLHMESLIDSKNTEPSESNTVDEVGKKSKDKKKKKKKEKLESSGDDLESNHIAVVTNTEEAKVSRDSQTVDFTALNDNISHLEEKVTKSKTKKKKEGQHLTGENGTLKKNEYESSKKRKRLVSDVPSTHSVDEKEIDDIKRRKLEGSKGCNDGVQSTRLNVSNGNVANAASRGPDNQLDEQTDRSIEATGGKTSAKKTTKNQGSAEPKTVNAFQRVKVDDVVFADEKLADNSYWAKGGADTGYGAKAQEILGQVKGRDFRHEKTKKKRGTYRGGVIDLQSHSVKFDYSDED